MSWCSGEHALIPCRVAVTRSRRVLPNVEDQSQVIEVWKPKIERRHIVCGGKVRLAMSYYLDLRDHLRSLEAQQKLVRIHLPINKDTELQPLVRLQYRGLPESRRVAMLFDNITDSCGRHYGVPYVICCLAGSQDIYAIGLQCRPDEIGSRWTNAQLRPIPPVIVDWGPVHEEIHVGESLLAHGGLDEFPVPNSTPGFDVAPFLTAPCWVTKDPESGIRNVGTYRAQLKAPDRTGVFMSTPYQGIAIHWAKAKRRGHALEAAVVLGAAPNIAYTSVTGLPRDVDEFSVAGGLALEPVQLVKCKTVDLEVPAYAEIVLEGLISIDELEPEAPFGEASGYVGQRENAHIFQIKCITHRRSPILQGFLSQFPPSEATVMRRVAGSSLIYKYLRHDCGVDSVVDAALHESSGSAFYVVVRLQRGHPSDARRVAELLAKRNVAYLGKVFVLVDDDVDPWDPDAVNWAIGTRSQPHRDVSIVRYPAEIPGLDFAIQPPGHPQEWGVAESDLPESSLMVVDATMKWDYPPISLPTREHMERALELWQKAGLPKLNLREPWCGYSLGRWTSQDEEDASLAVQGEYYRTGERRASQRQHLEPPD